MNVFFTCKNTLVILLQLYRLYVVYSENRKTTEKKPDFELTNISVISKPDMYGGRKKRRKREESESEEEDDEFEECEKNHKTR